MIRVGINGFGRIGRAIFRINSKNSKFKICAINDIDPNLDNHAYLLKYDSVYGRFPNNVECEKDKLIVNDEKINFYNEKDIDKVPWKNNNIDFVIDSSGIANNVILSKNLIDKKEVKKVIVTHSPKIGLDSTIIFGVNEKSYNHSAHNIVGVSICDSNASGPVLKLLEDEYGIRTGFITTLHPWLSYQNLLDGSLKSISSPGHYWDDFALGRGSTESIIPKNTTLVPALEKVFPQISKKLSAFSFRTPTSIVSSSDLTINLDRDVTVPELNQLFLAKSKKSNGILGYQEEQLVSIDFKGITESVFVDGRWTEVLGGKTIKLVLWYDNEHGYSNRVCDMIETMAAHI